MNAHECLFHFFKPEEKVHFYGISTQLRYAIERFPDAKRRTILEKNRAGKPLRDKS